MMEILSDFALSGKLLKLHQIAIYEETTNWLKGEILNTAKLIPWDLTKKLQGR